MLPSSNNLHVNSFLYYISFEKNDCGNRLKCKCMHGENVFNAYVDTYIMHAYMVKIYSNNIHIDTLAHTKNTPLPVTIRLLLS